MDRQTIQEEIDKAAARPGGGVVTIPAGTHTLGGSLHRSQTIKVAV